MSVPMPTTGTCTAPTGARSEIRAAEADAIVTAFRAADGFESICRT